MIVYLCMQTSTNLNIDDGDGGLGLVEVPSHPVHCFRDKVQHQIQINLIFLERGNTKIKVKLVVESLSPSKSEFIR